MLLGGIKGQWNCLQMYRVELLLNIRDVQMHFSYDIMVLSMKDEPWCFFAIDLLTDERSMIY